MTSVKRENSLRTPSCPLIDPGVRQVGPHLPLDIGCEESENRFSSKDLDCLEGVPDDLHVLLRHRLLREPTGFEGFGFLMREEALNLLHKAVIVQRKDAADGGIDLDPATDASARRRVRVREPCHR